MLFISFVSIAQVDSAGLKDAMQQLDKALIQKDEMVLQSVLHKDLSFGHSNGWVQSKRDVLNDFNSGKLVYSKMENSSSVILNINKKWATVKTNTKAEGTVNGNAFNLTLHVMQFLDKNKEGVAADGETECKTISPLTP